MASRTRRAVAATAVALGVMAGLTGTAGATPIGNEGCTPGYWKNHVGNWPSAHYTPGQRLDTVFTALSDGDTSFNFPSLADDTFLQALSYNPNTGGNEAAAMQLLRAAVAALLNSASPSVDYPLHQVQIASMVNAAINGGSKKAMENLKNQLDRYNSLGAPGFC